MESERLRLGCDSHWSMSAPGPADCGHRYLVVIADELTTELVCTMPAGHPDNHGCEITSGFATWPRAPWH